MFILAMLTILSVVWALYERVCSTQLKEELKYGIKDIEAGRDARAVAARLRKFL